MIGAAITGRLGARAVLCTALGGLAAFAGTAAAVTVSVSPANLVIPAGDVGQLRITNPGDEAATFDLKMGNYVIRQDGTAVVDPPQPPSRSARDWLSASPATIRLGAGESTTVTIRARRVSVAAPGDHHALVLITSRARPTGGVAVRTRVGIGVIVRVPGTLIRRVAAGRPFVARTRSTRAFRITLTNRGNVNERFLGGQVRFELRQRGRVVARLTAKPQSVLPGTSGTLTVPYRGRLRGLVTVRATVRLATPAVAGPGIASTPAPIVRTARIVL